MEKQLARNESKEWKKRRQLGERVTAKLGYAYLVDTFWFDGIALVSRSNDSVSTFHESAFVNAKAEIITDFVYDANRSAGFFWKGFSMVGRGGKRGYINRRGQEVIPLMYDRARTQVVNGLAAVALNGKWGFVDTTNRVVIPFSYTDAYSFEDSLAVVKYGAKWGVINRANRVVIPFMYESVLSGFSEGVLGVVLNGKAGAVDVQNRVVIPFKYSPADSTCFKVHGETCANCKFGKGIAFVRDDQGRIGAVDRQGREVIPLRYRVIFTYKKAKGQIIAIDENHVEQTLYYPTWLALPRW